MARILIVDDEAGLRRLAASILERSGHVVSQAADGFAALRLVEEEKQSFDLVLSDLIMPGMSGPELVERLRRLAPTLKVVFVSGYADPIVAHQEIHVARAGFLQKPFTSAQLSDKIQEITTAIR